MCFARWCRCGSIVVFLFVSPLTKCVAQAASPVSPSSVAPLSMGTAADALKPTPANTYPQIVRVSYVDGDVRLSRRAVDQKASQSDWEKVVAGVPLETGYSLVTGTG